MRPSVLIRDLSLLHSIGIEKVIGFSFLISEKIEVMKDIALIGHYEGVLCEEIVFLGQYGH